MELVYKKDGFITKLFACLFLVMFIIMCLVGNKVFATDDSTFTLTDETGVSYVLPNWLKNYNFGFFSGKYNLYGDSYYPARSYGIFILDDGITDLYIQDYGSTSYFNVTNRPIVFYTSSGGIPSNNTYTINLTEQEAFDTYYKVDNSSSCQVPCSIFNDLSYGYSQFNVLNSDNEVVFQGAPQPTVLAGIVEQQEMKPLEEILTLLPIVMIVVVSFLALRKALATLFNFLRTS